MNAKWMTTVALVAALSITPAMAQIAETSNDNAQVSQFHETFTGESVGGVPGVVSVSQVDLKQAGGFVTNTNAARVGSGVSEHIQITPTGDQVLGGSSFAGRGGNLSHTGGTPRGGRNDNMQ